MSDWYPFATIDQGNSAGAYTDTGEAKGLLHTTEGKKYEGARAAYRANNSWPHFTCSYERGFFQCWQHNSISLASRALKNLAGGTQTNTDNVVQIELVGTADRRNAESWGDQYVENFPKGYLDGIRDLMRWIEANHGVPRTSTVGWLPYPESSGNSRVRLTNAQWDAYSGWLGHQHAAENSHGDPGLINISYLLNVPPARISMEEDMLHLLIKGHNDPTYWDVYGTTKQRLNDYLDLDRYIWSWVDTQNRVNIARAAAGLPLITLIAYNGEAVKEDGKKHAEPFVMIQEYIDSLEEVGS